MSLINKIGNTIIGIGVAGAISALSIELYYNQKIEKKLIDFLY